MRVSSVYHNSMYEHFLQSGGILMQQVYVYDRLGTNVTDLKPRHEMDLKLIVAVLTDICSHLYIDLI